MSSPALAEGSRFSFGFTRLCKGLAVVLVGAHVILHIFPSSVTYVSLIPAGTIPFAWNLITAGYVEQLVIGAVISTLGLLFIGKLLEPIWGSTEFLKFIFVVNFLTYVCVLITAIALYYITRITGRHQANIPRSRTFSIEDKSEVDAITPVFSSIAVSFFIEGSALYLPTLIFGTYTSWIYLRYLQRRPETNLRGDPSDEFAFSTFFPDFLRPVIDPIESVFDRILCGRSEVPNEAKSYSLNVAALPSSDPTEASRRRERGARALEERLAAEQLSAGGSTEDLPRKDAAETV